MMFYSRTVWTVIVVAAIHQTLKNVLPICFAQLAESLGFSATSLGMLTFVQTLSSALAVPVWGAALEVFSAPFLLALSAIIGGTATILTAASSSFYVHIALRIAIGVSTCAILPTSQAILCELVKPVKRGRAFGFMDAFASLASSGVFLLALTWSPSWRATHIACGVAALLFGFVVQPVFASSPLSAAPEPVSVLAGTPRGHWTTTSYYRSRTVAMKAARSPTFVLLVLQGIFGATAWNAHTFLWAYYSSQGANSMSIGFLAVTLGLGMAIGPIIGGSIGDLAAALAERFARRGASADDASDDDGELFASGPASPMRGVLNASGSFDAYVPSGNVASPTYAGSATLADRSARAHPGSPVASAGAGGASRISLAQRTARSHLARSWVSVVSIVVGIPLYAAALYSSAHGTADRLFVDLPGSDWPFGIAASSFFLLVFGAMASWAPYAAVRPIMGDVVKAPAERAQVVSAWVALECLVASVLGAPVVAFGSEMLGFRLGTQVAAKDGPGADTFGEVLMGVSAIGWGMSAVVWFALLVFLARSGWNKSR